LIMEKNAQIKEMEAEMNNLVKEKENNVSMVSIPLNAVSITGVSTTTTTSTTIGEIPAATSVTAPYAIDQLEKVMEDMTLQGA
jgi:hypothetical protein